MNVIDGSNSHQEFRCHFIQRMSESCALPVPRHFIILMACKSHTGEDELFTAMMSYLMWKSPFIGQEWENLIASLVILNVMEMDELMDRDICSVMLLLFSWQSSLNSLLSSLICVPRAPDLKSSLPLNSVPIRY